jgi:pimeloyl-ACP methyl ester carboxylesterase
VQLIDIGDAQLEIAVWGAGEPVVFVQTGLAADELSPLARSHAFGRYRRIVYHRRGYGGSSPAGGPGSLVRDAADCRDLLAALDIERAHVVGYSYSGAVALQVAAHAPATVHTLTLIEPPPTHTPPQPGVPQGQCTAAAHPQHGGRRCRTRPVPRADDGS